MDFVRSTSIEMNFWPVEHWGGQKCSTGQKFIFTEVTFYKIHILQFAYSHLFNKRGAWNKRGGGAKVAKSLNVELGINEEGGIFGKN